jgi:hypothetical protein
LFFPASWYSVQGLSGRHLGRRLSELIETGRRRADLGAEAATKNVTLPDFSVTYQWFFRTP